MTGRQCGDCTMCCKLLPVRELAKPANTRCDHQSSKGCAVYHRAGFPPSCGLWSCRWLVDPEATELRRPDRSGFVVDTVPDLIRVTDNGTGEMREVMVTQVWIDPARPEAASDPAVRRHAERRARDHGEVLLLRHGSTYATALIAPSMTSNGQWVSVTDHHLAESRTGNLLFDKLSGEPVDTN
jgi:hypothetical protein